MTNTNADEITVCEASLLSGFSMQWIYNLCKENKIRSSKRAIGRVNFIFIDRASLLDYVAARGGVDEGAE